MSNAGPDPERLKELGRKLDEVQKRDVRLKQSASVSPAGIAFRMGTELTAGLLVGVGFGWGVDWIFGYFGIHTRPIFIVVFFILGAIAGIRNVVRVSREINEQMAGTSSAPRSNSDEE